MHDNSDDEVARGRSPRGDRNGSRLHPECLVRGEAHHNARLTAECIALVSGLNYSGSSMTHIAGKHGITRAAVSKRCVELTELLGIRPSRAMRSLTARKRYRDARIKSTQSHEPSPHPTHTQG